MVLRIIGWLLIIVVGIIAVAALIALTITIITFVCTGKMLFGAWKGDDEDDR